MQHWQYMISFLICKRRWRNIPRPGGHLLLIFRSIWAPGWWNTASLLFAFLYFVNYCWKVTIYMWFILFLCIWRWKGIPMGSIPSAVPLVQGTAGATCTEPHWRWAQPQLLSLCEMLHQFAWKERYYFLLIKTLWQTKALPLFFQAVNVAVQQHQGIEAMGNGCTWGGPPRTQCMH